MKFIRLTIVLLGLIWSLQSFSQSQNLPTGWTLLGNDAGVSIDTMTAFGNANSPTAISANVATVWTWSNTLGRWNFFTPSMTAQELTSYATAKGYGVLSSIAKGEGYWVNVKSPFTYSPLTTVSADIKPLQGSNSFISAKSSASGSGCSAIGIQTTSPTYGYVSISVTTVGNRATVNFWDSSSYFVFTLDYQFGNNTTGYNMAGTFTENISKFSGSASASSFRQTSWGSYVGFITVTMNNCTLSAAIG